MLRALFFILILHPIGSNAFASDIELSPNGFIEFSQASPAVLEEDDTDDLYVPPVAQPLTDEDNDVGEVVRQESDEDLMEPPTLPEKIPVPRTKPKPRPQTPIADNDDDDEVDDLEPPSPSVPKTFDLSNCKYARRARVGCYGGMSLSEKTKRILGAVKYVNKLHGTRFDGRYMLCTGYRESGFNPGALGADGERGMFQVMNATGKGALRYGVELPEFKKYSSSEYMTKMANSTVAQVELSFLTLKMKLTEWASGQSSSQKKRIMGIMNGTGSTDDYRELARRYNGQGAAANRYANSIKSCYACLKTKISENATSAGSEIQSCLNKAKH